MADISCSRHVPRFSPFQDSKRIRALPYPSTSSLTIVNSFTGALNDLKRIFNTTKEDLQLRKLLPNTPSSPIKRKSGWNPTTRTPSSLFLSKKHPVWTRAFTMSSSANAHTLPPVVINHIRIQTTTVLGLGLTYLTYPFSQPRFQPSHPSSIIIFSLSNSRSPA
jgi:hypothetical protein